MSAEITRRVAIDVTLYEPRDKGDGTTEGTMFLLVGSGELTLDDGSKRHCGGTGGSLVLYLDGGETLGRVATVDAVQLWRAIEASGYIDGGEPLRYPALTASEMGTIVYWLEAAIKTVHDAYDHPDRPSEVANISAERIEAALAKVRAAGLGHQPDHTAAPAETVLE